jgi:inosose dehydratase
LKIQCEYLNRVGRALKDLGLEFWIHNHDPEALNNAREIRADCDLTDPALVHLCLDTHWVLRGGTQPLPLLRELAPRVKALHLRNSQNGIWSESLGDGDIDHRAMCALLKEVAFSGWLIAELAYEPKTVQTRSLTDNLRISRDYVRAVFGV